MIMTIYDRLFGKNAEDRDLLLKIGSYLLRLDKKKEAEETFKEAIRIGPPSADAHLLLGLMYKKSGKIKEAEKEYRAALEIKPDNVLLHNQMVSLLLMSNRLTEAEKEFRKVLSLNPDSLEAHTNLGALLLKTGRYDESEKELKRAIQIDPEIGLPHRNLGALYSKTQRTEEAIKELETAVSLYKKNDDHQIVDQLNSILTKLKSMCPSGADKSLSLSQRIKEKKPIQAREPTTRDESWVRANKVLHELFDVYMNPKIQQKDKQYQLTSIISRNHEIVYKDDKFFELLNSEIEKTMKHGPAIMALMYLELRWAITGDDQHLKEMKEYQEKSSRMDSQGLTDVDLDK